jgi:hypothetical protein
MAPMNVRHSATRRGVVVLGLLAGLITQPVAAETARLDQIPHIHGIAASVGDPGRLYLATHHGLYLASPDGAAEKISTTADDLMGFAADPVSAGVFYASGHPPSGGNLGVIRSEDGGRTWTQVAKGVNGPVDFHAMDISKADPSVIYGTHGGLQVSRDGGKTWVVQGPLPGQTFDLAASAVDADTVYAATRGGLMRSLDAGKIWQPAHLVTSPASMVQTTADGTAYAWHHSDGNLVQAILEGFEKQGGRMRGWKETLSREQAEDVVTYLKSLWSFRSYACQGARHMACMRH